MRENGVQTAAFATFGYATTAHVSALVVAPGALRLIAKGLPPLVVGHLEGPLVVLRAMLAPTEMRERLAKHRCVCVGRCLPLLEEVAIVVGLRSLATTHRATTGLVTLNVEVLQFLVRQLLDLVRVVQGSVRQRNNVLSAALWATVVVALDEPRAAREKARLERLRRGHGSSRHGQHDVVFP